MKHSTDVSRMSGFTEGKTHQHEVCMTLLPPAKDSGKPLGMAAYGSIPHLPGSRTGPADHTISLRQSAIATTKFKNPDTRVIVTEKLDGSCVSVLRRNGDIVPLSRAGWPADTSPYFQHHVFYRWAVTNKDRFLRVLSDEERICGEWLYQCHGTQYVLNHEPFVAFDIMTGHERLPSHQFEERIKNGNFTIPTVLHNARSPFSVKEAEECLRTTGYHGAMEQAEGAVWRVESFRQRKGTKAKVWVVDFLCKYVHPSKVDGLYFPNASNGGKELFNKIRIQEGVMSLDKYFGVDIAVSGGAS